jgi:predicted nucleic acid-binding protein
MIYALDTNIISYILNGNTILDEKLNAVINPRNKVVIPLMAYYEARRGLLNNNAVNKMRVFDKLCERLDINDMTVSDMNIAATIYAKHKRSGTSIEDADILIAAQCIANGYVLVTNNIKHFHGIDNLKFENWTDSTNG